MCQTAGRFELGDGFERVAGADLDQIAAIQKLQKLNRELYVTNSSVAGLHIARVGAFGDRAFLDLAFESSDARGFDNDLFEMPPHLTYVPTFGMSDL